MPRSLEIHFSIGAPGDYSGVGYFSVVPLPLRPSFVFRANAGSEIDSYPESDLSGIASKRVATLVVAMTSGDSLTIHPSLAPRHLRKRFPWLRGLRFFDVFFPADREPRLVTAFDRSGQVLARHEFDRGAFF